MRQEDIDFFQGIINQILRYITKADIKNEKDKESAERMRSRFALLKQKNTAEAVLNEVLKLNTENSTLFAEKELKEMPFLKDLKYRKTVDGLHQFRYRRDGYNEHFTSKNYEVAKEKARKFLRSIKATADGINAKHVNTLDYVANIWFTNKKAHVALDTYRSYLSVYRNHIKEPLGNKAISRILPMDLQPFFNELFEFGGKTCEQAKVILNNVFNFAVANRLCPTNPMKAVIIERHYRKPGQKLTDEQIERFKSIMLKERTGLGTAYLIILYSGIRGAELEKMSFNWEKGTFTVYNAKLKKSQKKRPENITRTVPIFPALYLIRDRIENDEWHFDKRKISNTLPKFWGENSVKDLRHTFTSKAREAGIENELVNLWTGHLPGANVTANVYTHFSEEYQKRKAKKLKPY